MNQAAPSVRPSPGSADLVAGVAESGSLPARIRAAARAVFRFPGARRGRKPTGPDRPAPGRDGHPGPPLFRLDRPSRIGSAAPSLRDVSRGARAGAGGEGEGPARCLVADLLVRARWPWPRSRPNLVRKLASLAVWGLRLVAPRIPSWRRELLNLADIVLPNSLSEAAQLVRLFGVARERVRAVPNGVLATVASASPELFQERWGADPFVLSVGRIEPRKNTLALIRAIRPLGLPLVVIGEAHPAFRALRTRLPARGWGSGRLAGTARPSRSAAGLGLRRGQGLCLAKLVRDARIGRARGRPRRAVPS